MPAADGLSAAGGRELPLSRAVAREAARWLMRLHAGDVRPAELERCARWRAADPEHERAWQRAEQLNRKLGLLPAGPSLQALDRPRRPDRRAAVKALVLLLTATPGGYLAWREREAWTPGWAAQYRTAVGERCEIALADGGQVWLNTDSALDLAFRDAAPGRPGERLLLLRRGEIAVRTGRDVASTAAPPRPFVVQTAQGRIHALGTHFVVREWEAARGGPSPAAETTQVSVQQGAVEIQPAAPGSAVCRVQAGESVRFDTQAAGPVARSEAHHDAWTRGQIQVRNQRLADFAAELGRYRRGVLRCTPEVAELRITGVFQLDRIEAVLAALPDTLPVRLAYRTRWWVTIDAAEGRPAAFPS